MTVSKPQPQNGGSTPARGRRELVLALILLAFWTLLVSNQLIPLALDRYFHVDEIQVAYNAALLGIHDLPDYLNYYSPFVVPLSWVAGAGGDSWTILLKMRALFLPLFILDLVLIALFAPRTRGWLAVSATLVAATLVEPFWRHGFEIRHDVLMLAGSLGLFALAQRAARGSAGSGAFFLAGLLAGWMQMNSFKALLVWPAGLVLIAAAAYWGRARPRWLAAAGWTVAGIAAGIGGGMGLLAVGGIGDDFIQQMTQLGRSGAAASRFSPWGRLLELLSSVPHLTALAAGSIVRLAWEPRRKGWSGEGPSIVTAVWLVLMLVVLLLNPVPYTYNLVHLIPFLFLAAVDGFGSLWRLADRGARWALAVIAALSCIGSFIYNTSEGHIGRVSGSAQRAHIEAAEALTSPEDPVLDAAGLVLTRRPPGRDWMLHSLFMPSYRLGERTSFRELMAAEAPPVLITNYRWGWLGRADRSFMGERYTAISRNLYVLGGPLAESHRVHRSGRYVVLSPGGEAIAIDGSEVPSGTTVSLERGEHSIALPNSGAVIAWIGPTLDRLPSDLPLLPGGDVFVSD